MAGCNFISFPCCFRVIPGVNLRVLGSSGSPSGLPILTRGWLHLPSSEEILRGIVCVDNTVVDRSLRLAVLAFRCSDLL
jgi:hypothetical protein